jgi:hypothetical protein
VVSDTFTVEDVFFTVEYVDRPENDETLESKVFFEMILCMRVWRCQVLVVR